MTLEEIKRSVGGLTGDQRTELADYLLDTLEPAEPDVTEAWQKELVRRMDEIRSGQATGIPAEDVLRRLREKYP